MTGVSIETYTRSSHPTKIDMHDTLSKIPSSNESQGPHARMHLFPFWRCFWLTFLVVSLGAAWYSFYAPPNDVAWANSYSAAQQQAAQSGKPIILSFTGTWCSPCRIMKRQVWADAEVMAMVNSNFTPVVIDVDDPHQAALMARYRVTGAPVTIITDAQGNVLDWRSGGVGKSEFLGMLETAHPLGQAQRAPRDGDEA